MLAWILLSIAIVYIFYLLQKGPKIIYKDQNDLKQAEYEKQLRIQKDKVYKEVDSQKESMYQKIREEEQILYQKLDSKKQQMILDMENELDLRYKRNDQLKRELAEWIEEEKLAASIEVNRIKEFIEEWRSKQNAAVEAYKKLDEIKNEENFYRISLTNEEEEDLYELHKAILKLRNPLPFRKAVYSIYYQPKINELCLRIVGNSKVAGIYKITHIESGRTYVGQSVDISNRWKQHAKRGSGAEIATSNKLYPAMLEDGIEAFTFEVIEEITDSNKLNAAEKYWQDYFKSQEFGYSMR